MGLLLTSEEAVIIKTISLFTVCVCVKEREISLGVAQLMLVYWSLWPEPINTKVKGQQLGNNDSVLMMCVCTLRVQYCIQVWTV